VDQLIRIGVDTSKSVFVLHGVDAAEKPVLRRKLRRKQVTEFFGRLEPTKVGLGPGSSLATLARPGHETI
jgi:transposase